jgi:hypothetical protein
MRWGRMLANWGLDWCQAPDAVGADASKLGSGSVPGTCCGQPDASKQGAGSGARHLLWGGRMLANRGRDRPGTCCGAVGC